jgi:uncharacterized spore protein YtfJ
MSDQTYERSFEIVCDKLVALAKKQGVVGAPVEMGDTTILPLSEIKAAFGGGGGQGKGEGDLGTPESGKGQGIASAGAGSIKVNPMAFIVIEGETIRLEAIDEQGGQK